MSNENEPARLPSEIKEQTMGSLPLDTPFFIPPDMVYQRFETDELFVDIHETGAKRRVKKELGYIAVMRDMIMQDGQMIFGHVLDLRNLKSTNSLEFAPPAERPDDQEEANQWEEEIKYMTHVRTIAYRNPENLKTVTTGDMRFAAAALRLAGLVDEIYAQQKADKIALKKERKLRDASKSKPSLTSRILMLLNKPM